MKILMVVPTAFYVERGTPKRIQSEALALKKNGHDVTIATYHIGSTPLEIQKNEILVERIPRIFLWYTKTKAGPSWQKILLDIFLLFKTLSIALNKNPAVLHGHLHEGVLISWWVSKILFWKKIKVIGDFHGGLVDEMQSYGYLNYSLLKKFFVWLENYIERLPSIALTSSSSLYTVLIAKRQQQTIYLPDVAPEKLPTASTEELREKYKIQKNVFVCLYAGGITPDKGIATLYSIIETYKKTQTEPVCFIIASTFPKGFVIPPTISSYIHVISPLTEETLTDLLSLSDIALDPKTKFTKQGSGKILAYMSYSLPILGFNSETNRSYLGEENSTLLSESIEEMVKKITDLRVNISKRQSTRTQIEERAKIFSFEKMKENLQIIYTSL